MEKQPRVLLVGHGEMGAHHQRTLRRLEERSLVQIAGVADIEPDRLREIGHSVTTYTDVSTALHDARPDIVGIATNTPTHGDIIEETLRYGRETGVFPALFVEKPIEENSKRAVAVANQLRVADYEKSTALAFAYLIRFSPALDETMEYLRLNGLHIVTAEVTWQKRRAPTRPSPGIHTDETTHAIDTLVSYLLPLNGQKIASLQVQETQSIYTFDVVDKMRQTQLYERQMTEVRAACQERGMSAAETMTAIEEAIKPMAEIRYALNATTAAGEAVKICGISSFLRPPLRRQIRLTCDNGKLVVITLDAEGHDVLEIERKRSTYDTGAIEKGRVYQEWSSFLDYVRTGQRSPRLAGLDDALFDLSLTEALGTGRPGTIITR
jgi:predicted dehydrogenase